MSNQENIDITQLYKDGVWIDERTGLMWSRPSLGQQWQKGKAIGSAEEFDFFQAQQTATTFTLAGFNDWQVPTLDELKTLLRDKKKAGYDCPKGALFRPIEGSTWWGWFWSSTGGGTYSQIVAFTDGTANFTFSENKNYVRLVRHCPDTLKTQFIHASEN
ncbi:DUF1566 domain-containing protein [Acinetobacter tjernbergiae]|uniref:Lcl C-terminal domain-containing protein n=1 Tax=Acinetobacter tjernbergiae DSM 14971 = CIP 107465 TaxID=1120928 RepID=V2UL00_9GAMM|nr:DUF1566 domain-containing protein [Acinetobacter tjernbergiae]ESK55398.1 hypothetical protein F990_01859 [Acinetobacter tjernbergiae DSM 14971 = CIP 107465]